MALLFCSKISAMQFSKHPVLKWLPVLLMMIAIFIFSATPSDDVQLSFLQYAFYKAGHVTGYLMLTLAYWRAFGFNPKRLLLIWVLALLYAATDEYHQSFVFGRHPAAFDVFVFDNAGALIAVWIANRLMKQKQPIHEGMVVDQF